MQQQTDEEKRQGTKDMKAALRIWNGIDEARERDERIDASTARLIAASIHKGPGSHLERFAASGHLNPAGALSEIDDDAPTLSQVPWQVALWEFLEPLDTAEPDTEDSLHRSLIPMVYAQPQASDPDGHTVGQWLRADTDEEELLLGFNEVLSRNELGPHRQITITATIGFFDIDVVNFPFASDISCYGRGISRFGEAYAAFAHHHGMPLSESVFLSRHYGDFANMNEFLGKTENLTPQNDWLILTGQAGVHVFKRDPLEPVVVGPA